MSDFNIAFFGNIIPEFSDINSEHPIAVTVSSPNYVFDMKFHIKRSIFSCLTNHAEHIDILSIRNHVEFVIQNYIDTLGFLYSNAFHCIIKSVLFLDSGQLIVFDTHAPINSDNLISMKDDAFACIHDEYFKLSIRDFRGAIDVAHETAFYCFRAIESIRRSFFTDKVSESWSRLRDDLNIDRIVIERIQTKATEIRHGGTANQTWEERKEFLETTQEIIRRYILYLRQNRKKLEIEPLSYQDVAVVSKLE